MLLIYDILQANYPKINKKILSFELGMISAMDKSTERRKDDEKRHCFWVVVDGNGVGTEC